MPKQAEKARKLRLLSKGKGVKAPKVWWSKMKRKVMRQNPLYGKKRIGAIVGGIWSQSSISTKKKIVRRYQK